MIHNYFERTLYFNPQELDDHPEFEDVRSSVDWRKSNDHPIVSFKWRGFYFSMSYHPIAKTYSLKMNTVKTARYPEERADSLYVGGGDQIGKYEAVGTVEAAYTGIERFKEDLFNTTLTHFMVDVFRTPYADRKVEVVSKDEDNHKAALLIDGLVKVAFAFRPKSAQPYRLSVATPKGIKRIETDSFGKAGVQLRKVVTSIYRGYT